MSVLPEAVEIVAPLIVILSTTNDVKPAMSVVAAPKVNVDVPKVVVGFAKLPFEIAALPDKLAFVNAVAVTVTVLSVTVWTKPPEPAKVSVSAVLYVSVPVSPAKSINWLTVAKSKLPEPSVFKNCPAEPSPFGNVNVVVVVTALGAFKPIKAEPLFVPSFNFTVPPTVAELPIITWSIAKFASAVSAELPVSVPATWSNMSVKYWPPITDTLFALPSPPTPPSPINNLSPLFACVPVPYV